MPRIKKVNDYAHILELVSKLAYKPGNAFYTTKPFFTPRGEQFKVGDRVKSTVGDDIIDPHFSSAFVIGAIRTLNSVFPIIYNPHSSFIGVSRVPGVGIMSPYEIERV